MLNYNKCSTHEIVRKKTSNDLIDFSSKFTMWNRIDSKKMWFSVGWVQCLQYGMSSYFAFRSSIATYVEWNQIKHELNGICV